jgi:hypothetical protein
VACAHGRRDHDAAALAPPSACARRAAGEWTRSDGARCWHCGDLEPGGAGPHRFSYLLTESTTHVHSRKNTKKAHTMAMFILGEGRGRTADALKFPSERRRAAQALCRRSSLAYKYVCAPSDARVPPTEPSSSS